MNEVLASSIAVVVVDRNNRSVDRELLEIRASMSVDLRVQVREDTSLQERVLGEINASYNVSRLELYANVNKGS